MSDHADNDVADDAGGSLGGVPDGDTVASRAEGRPPEEQSSEDPAAQSEAILQESEDRILDVAEGSDPTEE
jgi:hypothetical protein